MIGRRVDAKPSQEGRKPAGAGVVQIGSRVHVRYSDGEDMFVMVDGESADPMDAMTDRVSANSPLGRALVGRSVGEQVIFRAPGGVVSVVVESVS